MDEEEASVSTASRWRWSLIPMYGLTFAANVCSDAAATLAGLAEEVASHHNYLSEREFAADVRHELENLLGGDDG